MIQPGQELLHYRLVEQIGEGGMGVVWLARDTSLDRDVAIKLLPASFAADPMRMARFEREAKLLASLNHPNIAAVHGLHEAPDGDETVRFIAMEYVPGEDLAQRLARGPMAVDEALEITRKIAMGMAAAHDNGTIHRDLKPANVRMTPTGEVKVLDFGLARAAETTSGADPTHSPTITSAGTTAGMLLGTAAYMSPEQARGRTVDRRADVWAFGCLLYECLTGKRAFPGETISDILAEVIKTEPEWAALPAATPTAVRRLLRRCLAKDADDRLRDLGDAALDLVEADEPVTGATAGAVPARMPRGLVVAGIVGGLVLGFVLGAALMRGGADEAVAPATAPPTTAGVIELPGSAEIAYGAAPIGYDSPMLTISADGRYLVYIGREGRGDAAGSRLFRRDLASFAPPEPIAGTEGALAVFFSPFEHSVAFVTNEKLARIDINGDRLQFLGDVRSATRLIWADDRMIYVGDSQAKVLRLFPEDGGESTTLGELPGHGFSDVLPGGHRVLFHQKSTTLRCDFGIVQLADFSGDEEERHVVLTNAYDARVRGDRIYFIRDSALLSAPFDTERAEVTGEPEILVRDVAVDSIFGQAQLALSPSGTVAYLPGGDRSLGTIAWIDRDGQRGTLPVEPRVYGTLDIDPTDRRIVVHVGDVRDYIWIYDLDRGTGRRLPTNASVGWPVWTASGDSVSYTESGETYRLMLQKVDAREAPKVIRELPHAVSGAAWSPDDRLVAISLHGKVHVTNVDGQVVAEIDRGFMGHFSPDGHWITYGTDQGGVYETIVSSWPDREQTYSIQTDGGIEGIWSRGSRELFYRLGNRWYATETTLGDSFEWKQPQLAFEIPFLDTPGRSYAVTSDGQRLYTIVQAEEDVVNRIRVVSGGMPSPSSDR